jgi:hypothetical protein
MLSFSDNGVGMLLGSEAAGGSITVALSVYGWTELPSGTAFCWAALERF